MRSFRHTLLLLIGTAPLLLAAEERDAAAVLRTHCLDCHGDDEAEADVRVDRLLGDRDFDRDFVKWEHLLTRLVDRSMPPREVERPTDAEYARSVDWLRRELSAVEARRAEDAPRWMRRLNRKEYDNTIRDLFGIEGLRPSEAFPVDDALHGFDNVAEGLVLSPLHVDAHLAAAADVLDEVFDTGDRPETRTVRHTFRFYGEKIGDAQLRVRDGNSVLGGKEETKRWIGGPFHARFDVPRSGIYRLVVRGVPHQFGGAVAGFTTRIDNRDRADHDRRPVEGKPFEIVRREARLSATGKPHVFEIEWTENHHRLGRKRAGVKESASPFRRLQAVRKEFPDDSDRWITELGWPYLTDVEVEVTGPIHESWPPRPMQRLLAPAKGAESFEPILAAFLPRAFRRPVSPEEVRLHVGIAEAEVANGANFHAALKHALAAALVSPHFLFLVESPPADSPRGAYELSDFELATRLSYFLWSSMPDDELLAVAAAGKLRDPDVLREQTARLLADPRARALTDGFAEQWLETRRIPALMPEPSLFDEVFDDSVHDAMATEPLAFFDHVRRGNRPIVEFLSTDVTMLNAPLARLYGVEGVEGQEFRAVEIDDPRRGGLVTQAGFLALTSEATRTSPVKRGAWILERLFHRPPPPPPPNVGNLVDEEDNTPRPIHAQLERHRANPACASCHRRIDPYGLALESFDAVGAFRERERVVPPDQIYLPKWKQKPVDFDLPERVEFDDGGVVSTIPEFKAYLLSRKDDFARGFAEQLLVYALGRELLVRDQTAVDRLVADLRGNEYRLHALVQSIVASPPFRTR